MVVTRLNTNVIEAKILGGEFDGHIHLIPRIIMASNEDDLPYIIRRRQFPVRLCFAMTINKSQGQSFQTLGIDLRTPVFTHGQLYVAMSRVTDVRQLTVCVSPETSEKVMNIVFPEVLLT